MNLFVLALAVVLLLLPAPFANAETDDPFPQVRTKLEALGFHVDDESYQKACEVLQDSVRQRQRAGIPADSYLSEETFTYHLLMLMGMGNYNYATNTWTPSSDQIYVFDAEVFNIEGMYTEFLQGVQVIAKDAVFTDISEDLSGMDERLEGTRKVSFACNGTPYSFELTSSGDWIDPQIIPYVNQALKEQNCSGQLHIISSNYDQIVFLVYGSGEMAGEMRLLMGTEDIPFLPSGGSPLDPLLNLLENLF